MKFEKIMLDEMPRCYCASSITMDGEDYIIMASEAIDGPCYAYLSTDFSQRETVWEKGGGTMSIVGIPGTNGEFLSVQRFFPGFQSEKARIVWCKRIDDAWQHKVVIDLPFIHRFDILESDGKKYFLGATLCGSKKDREDWSDPGKVWVGEVPVDWGIAMQVTPLLEGLVKNHGYWRGSYNGKPAGYVTCESGIYRIQPPFAQQRDWNVEHLVDKPISDVAVYDLDGDGQEEMAIIEPFHGNGFEIRKSPGSFDSVVYRYPGKLEFIHTVWTGEVLGKPIAICGARRAGGELFYVHYDQRSGSYKTVIIDQDVGPANVWVINQKDRSLLLSANHTKNEAAVYVVTG